MVKLRWRLSGDLIYHVFSIKNLQTNFTIKSLFSGKITVQSIRATRKVLAVRFQIIR